MIREKTEKLTFGGEIVSKPKQNVKFYATSQLGFNFYPKNRSNNGMEEIELENKDPRNQILEDQFQ